MRTQLKTLKFKTTHSFSTCLDGDGLAELSQTHKEVMNLGRRLGRQCEVEDNHGGQVGGASPGTKAETRR
jgi:hypothetical protein